MNMQKKPENMTPAELVDALAALQGSTVAAAATIGASRASLHAWKVGRRAMREQSRLAIVAVLNDPVTYTKYKVLARRPGRPTAEQLELFDKGVARAKLR